MNDFEFLSHPNKPLINHLKGILSLSEINDLFLLAVVFHDVGKMSDNFQKKIRGEKISGYSNHAHISAYYLINGFVNNKEILIKRFKFITEENFEMILLVLTNIVIGHHGYLRNIDELFSVNKKENGLSEWDEMIAYLETIKMTDYVNKFFKENSDILGCELTFTNDLDKHEFYHYYGRIHDIDKWEENALQYYFDTIVNYAELVNGDRRDASQNKSSYRNEVKKRYGYSLENNLEWIFKSLKSEKELDRIRNLIRKQAIENLQKQLKNDKNTRVFTLTAPTGSGKTYMMLQLAVEILKEYNYDYDIIYSLPYLSIIDQTIKILNDKLRIETLNYTSASDICMKLQTMLENEVISKELIEYVFSENSFDHSFIITTFNQLFETFLNNQTSKLMKLKNFKKRIFLIDEFQAVSPSQYYTLVNILNEFCKKYDSFAIISTATMPSFNVKWNDIENRNLVKLFKKQFYPKELLNEDIFNNDVFDRYVINFMGEVNQLSLYEMVNKSDKSALLILNTIRTSQVMYSMFATKLNFDKIYLLNAYISPADRFKILKNIFADLKNEIKILVVSTQVIEAGVDISFPVVYRDTAPPSSVVQASGRCNRNGELGKEGGQVFLFLYKADDNISYDCNMVYNNTISNNFRNDVANKISPMTEKEFHLRCKKYFIGLAMNTEHGKINDTQNIVDNILHGNFYELGKYRFIVKNPDTYTIYVGESNELWNNYVELYNKLKETTTYEERDYINIKFKQIRNHILKNSVNIRAKAFDTINVDESYGTDKESSNIFGVYKLLDNNRYDPNVGLIEL